MSLAKRLYTSIAANSFGQAVTVVSQLLLTPLFFTSWGASMYGEWLILSSIPAYLTMLDFGVGSAAGNEMSMLAAAGKQRQSKSVFHGAVLVASLACCLVLVLGLLAAFGVEYAGLLSFKHIEQADVSLILIGLALTVCVAFYNGLILGGFRAGGFNARGIMLGNVSRLAEALLAATLLVFHSTPLLICYGVLITKLIFSLTQMALMRRACPWLFSQGWEPEKGLLGRLLVPSLGFFLLPLGQALALQAPITIIGATMGSASVALFSALRTLARTPVQLTNILNHSVWPEMTRCYSAGDLALFRKIHRGTWGASLIISAGCAVVLLMFGQQIVQLWLHGSVEFNASLMAALCACATLVATWTVSQIALSATNRHSRFAVQFVLINALGMALMWFVAQHTHWWGVQLVLVGIDVVLLLVVLQSALVLTQDNITDFVPGAVREATAVLSLMLSKIMARRA
jgi:O-antigen/teichoic acid export membrane protein